MSQQADSGLSVPVPTGSVRALQASPEVLTPVRHGFLWKRSRMFKTWMSRWFQLDVSGFLYAASPKVIRSEGHFVLSSPVGDVQPLPPLRYHNGATMYGMRVVSVSGRSKDLYTDDPAALAAWFLDLSRSNAVARDTAQRKAMVVQPKSLLLPFPPPALVRNGGELHLSDICEVDWSHMLGSGLFACVLRARLHDTGEPVAIKIIKAEAYREYGDIIEREAAVWAATGNHPHVVQLKQTLRSGERMYFISELCEGGCLVERLAASATYCEREVAWLARQLLSAVQHLHENAIVHMDIKPENVVFATRREDSCIKLIDFSLASFFYSPTDPGGTPDYVAPELLNQHEHYTKNGCGPEVDMWAVGVMIFFLLSGLTPFQAPTLEMVMQRAKTGEWAFHGRRWAMVSEGGRDLISSLMRMEPSERLTAAEALEHPWLRRPDSLSQALLQDAIAAFRLAAAATLTQQRTSWVKQASGDLMTTAGTNVTNLSPHTSLSRFAAMASNVVPAGLGTLAGVSAGMSAASTNGGGQSLLGLGLESVTAVMGGGAMGGNSVRGSLAGVQRDSNSLVAVAAAPTAATAAAGHGAGSPTMGGGSSPAGSVHPNSMNAGGGARYAAAMAMAPQYAGNSGNVRMSSPAVAVVARISPHSAAAGPHVSPHNSHHSPGGSGSAAARSPRSPLGMRTRRASDTMAYTLAITEREESIHQMQAQGIPVPATASGMPWPIITSARARRASELLPIYGGNSGGVVPSPSAGQTALTAAVAASTATVDLSNHSMAGARYGQATYLHPHLAHHQHAQSLYGHPPPLRGASGLSVMTSASSVGIVAVSRDDGRPTDDRSNPELSSLLRMQSSNGFRSGISSSNGTTPHTLSRDGARTSWASLPLQAVAHAAVPVQPQSPVPAAQAMDQQQAQAQQQGMGQGQGTSAEGGFAAGDQVLLARVRDLRQGVPGKSHSYNAMPVMWLDRPVGRSSSSAEHSSASITAGGSDGNGGKLLRTLQRRASMSFTLGASVSALTLMPHGPSPLSNSSGGRCLAPESHAAAGSGGGGGPTPALLLMKRPSRGVSGGGNLLGRSNSGSAVGHGFAATSTNTGVNPMATAYGSGSGGTVGAMVGVASAGASQYGSSSSMYAAVLRSNLSGHGLSIGGGGGSGTGGATGTGCGSTVEGGMGETLRQRLSLNGSGSVPVGPFSQGAAAAAVVAAAAAEPGMAQAASCRGLNEAQATSPAPLSDIPGICGDRSSGGSDSNSSIRREFSLVNPCGGADVGSYSDVSDSTQLWDERKLSDPMVPSPAAVAAFASASTADQMLHNDSRGVMHSFSSNMVSASHLLVSDRLATQGSLIEATFMSASVHPASIRSGSSIRGEQFSAVSQNVMLRSPSSNGSGLKVAADGRPLSASISPARNAEGEVTPDFRLKSSNGAAATATHSKGGSSGGYVVSTGVTAVSEGSQRWLRPHSGSITAVARAETWSCSLSSGGSPHIDVVRSDSGGSPHIAAATPTASADSTAAAGASSSGVVTVQTSSLPRRASSRLVLETIPSEDPDSLSCLVGSVREERAVVAADGNGGVSSVAGSSGSGVIGVAGGNGSTAHRREGAGSCSNGPAGIASRNSTLQHSLPVPATASPPASPLPQLEQMQSQRFGVPSSPLSCQSIRAFLSPQASCIQLCQAIEIASRNSIVDAGCRRQDNHCDDGSTEGWQPQQQTIGSGGGAAAASSSIALAERSGSVRRAVTVNNMRLHATQAAAAAAAAADMVHPSTLESDPFAGWDYPPPSLAVPQQRAASAVGLSGPSLVALLAQAAQLAQEAQKFAAVQIANSQSSSAGSSFTSQRSVGVRGGGGGCATEGSVGAVAGHIPPFDMKRRTSMQNPGSVRRALTTTNLNLKDGQSAQSSSCLYQSQQQQQLHTIVSRENTSMKEFLEGGPELPILQTTAAATSRDARGNVQWQESSTVGGSVAAMLLGAGGSGTAAGGVSPFVRNAAAIQAHGHEPLGDSHAWTRRATTSNDLRERAAITVQLSGHSMVHRLVGQQGSPLVGGGSLGATGTGLHSSSPPRDPASPASVSSRGSTFPVVPSRLSNSGTGSTMARSAAAVVAAATAGCGGGSGGGNQISSPNLSTQSSLGSACATVSASQYSLTIAMQQQQQQQQQPPQQQVMQQQLVAGHSSLYHMQQQQHLQQQQQQQQQQLQQLQQFHHMQQLRYQQQKPVVAGGRSSRMDLTAAAPAGVGAGATAVSATTPAADLSTSPSGVRRTSFVQLPLPLLEE